ncbi:MAG: glycine cleavage system protein GcvH [Myxococcota bacterium]
MNVPADLKYTDHDEWVRVDGNIVTLGISDFAQGELGELVHVELPEVGESFDAGDAVCEVESVKAVAEVYSPLAGKVVEVNGDLEDSEETINEAPYNAGWLVKLEVADLAPLDGLMNAEAYSAKLDA